MEEKDSINEHYVHQVEIAGKSIGKKRRKERIKCWKRSAREEMVSKRELKYVI